MSSVGWSEEVEAVLGCADDHAGHLRVPVELLHIALSLVDEVQLSRDVGEIVSSFLDLLRLGVVLQREVPQSELVVGPGDCY